MAKPICIIKYDVERVCDSGRMPKMYEINEAFETKFPDYYVFAFPSDSLDDVFDVNVFHEKDFTDVQYEELKGIIEESIKEINTK